MAYQVIARKYRPNTFDSLLGQQHVVSSLKNAIIKGRVHHGYLFSGPRGVGKTSAARILAKAINCLNRDKENADPCNECTNCKEISDANSIDVVEMDAASNRGIDDIRELRTLVNYLPSKSKYKIFIIDEVHQLSTAAFDALLKTLEEPPKHVIFILATTSPHKVKETIRSRCLHYNFRRISTLEIANHIKNICENMDITTNLEAMKLIAKAGDGSMRDSQSILEAIVSFSEGEITQNKVRSVLGLTAEEYYLKFISFVSNKNLAELLLLIEQLINEGHNINHYVLELLNYWRALVIVKSMPDRLNQILSYPEDTLEKLKDFASRFNRFQLAEIINQMVTLIRELKNTTNERFEIESTLYKIVNWDNFTSLGEILKRIEEIEHRILSKTEGVSIKPDDAYTKQKEQKQILMPTKKEFKNDEEIISAWIKILNQEKSLTAQIIVQSTNYNWDSENEVLEITFDNEFYYNKCQNENTKQYLQQTFSQLVKKNITLQVKYQKKNLSPKELEKLKKNQELLLTMFDGELIE